MSNEKLVRLITAKISELSRTAKVPYETMLTTFLIERLLARLISNPRLSKSLVFKGGYVGLRVYSSDRYTVDLDALVLHADIDPILKQTAEAIEGDLNDGAWFLFESEISLQTQGEYGGRRQSYRAGLGVRPEDSKRSQVVNFDIGIGDPVTPAPVRTKTAEMAGSGALSWQVYPIETIIAEKIQTLVVRGGDNSRAKDIYDLLHHLPKANDLNLQKAIEECFSFRQTEVPSNMHEFLKKIDRALLKKGWKSATSSLHNAPSFDEAYDTILDYVKKLNPPQTRNKK